MIDMKIIQYSSFFFFLLISQACVAPLQAPETIGAGHLPNVNTSEPDIVEVTPPDTPPLPYDIYTWQDETNAEGLREIVLYGENLQLFDYLEIGSEQIQLTPNEDGSISRGIFPEGLYDRHIIYAVDVDQNIRYPLPEVFINNKNEIPQINKCRFFKGNELIPDCIEGEEGIQFTCLVEGDVPIKPAFTTAYIGRKIIPAQQVKYTDNTISGYLLPSQIQNLEGNQPFMVDFGLGQKSLSENLFFLPD